MKQPIYNQSGGVKGYTNDIGNRIIIEDEQGKLLGFYIKHDDRTYNKSGANVGKGNQIMVLLAE
jgi:hypothetical protein